VQYLEGSVRIGLTSLAAAAAFAAFAAPADAADPRETLHAWHRMALELTRHTATYSPPVASRAYAYMGVAAFEVVASGSDKLQSLGGQLNALSAVPKREAGAAYDEAVALDAALSSSVHDLFGNTGPTGQRAMDALDRQQQAKVTAGLAPDVVARSQAYGRAVAGRILAWSRDDGGAVVENMGFPREYTLVKGPAYWVPTNPIVQQQLPLLPYWGKNRPFAMPTGASCPAPAPTAYSEDPNSAYYKEADELYQAWKTMTPERRAIARFWADDAMLTVTPPGHWLSIVLQLLERDQVPLDKSVDILARLGIAEADAFIGCWQAKFVYNTVRPITYIRRLIDPKFDPVVNTPPFPEYPSGHSTQSAAAAAVLTAVFGDNFAFNDDTGQEDGPKPRSFPSFRAAADEAGISRLYGGIHYRVSIDRGIEQGNCIAAYTIALKTWR
jgi:hypothetical protein